LRRLRFVQRLFVAGDISHIDADLAVVHLARSSAPLSRHADRRLALFEDARRVDEQHAVGPTDRRPDLPNQFVDHGLRLPRLLANELLHRLSILLVQIGNGFDVLAFYVGKQTGDVFGGVLPLGLVFQTGREWFDEIIQSLEHTLQGLGLHFRFRHQFFVTYRKSSFHDLSPFRLTPFSGTTVYKTTYIQSRPIHSQSSLEAFCRRWRVRELSLFGSVLRDAFTPESDVDVLVSFDPDATWSLWDFTEMRDELGALVGRPVDLVEREGLRNPFRRDKIMQTRKVIYVGREG
jgi:predicted nucleotidyltransferase